MEQWANFMQEVEQQYLHANEQRLSSTSRSHCRYSPIACPMSRLHIGDEHGVQGWFTQLIGQAMDGVKKLLHGRIGEYIFFGDYKSCIIKKAGKKVPDKMIRFSQSERKRHLGQTVTLIAVWAWRNTFRHIVNGLDLCHMGDKTADSPTNQDHI